MLSLRLLILFIAALLCVSAPIYANGTEVETITRRDESTKSDFVHTWTPSVAITVLNNVVYAKSSNKASDLYRKLGADMMPVMNTKYWKDNGASKGFHVLAEAMPTMGEAVVKAAMV